MSDYKNLTLNHQEDLRKTREIISNLIGELALFSCKSKAKEHDVEYWNLMWGEKENVTSVMAKLSTMLLKLIPLEQEITLQDQKKYDNSADKPIKLEDNDKEIIKRYIKKYSK